MPTAKSNPKKGRLRFPNTWGNRIIALLAIGCLLCLVLRLTEFTYKSARVHVNVTRSTVLLYWGADADFRDAAIIVAHPFPAQSSDPGLITGIATSSELPRGLHWNGYSRSHRALWISPRARLQRRAGGIVLPFAWFWPALGVALFVKLLFWKPGKQTGSKCLSCGYDLRGAISDTCAECGTPITRTPHPAPQERDESSSDAAPARSPNPRHSAQTRCRTTLPPDCPLAPAIRSSACLRPVLPPAP